MQAMQAVQAMTTHTKMLVALPVVIATIARYVNVLTTSGALAGILGMSI